MVKSKFASGGLLIILILLVVSLTHFGLSMIIYAKNYSSMLSLGEVAARCIGGMIIIAAALCIVIRGPLMFGNKDKSNQKPPRIMG